MRGRNSRQVRSPLMRAAERFAEWRQTRELGTRIPEGLWKLAVKLASTHGVCRTSSMLRLDYYSLKRRLESVGEGLDEGVFTGGQLFVSHSVCPH